MLFPSLPRDRRRDYRPEAKVRSLSRHEQRRIAPAHFRAAPTPAWKGGGGYYAADPFERRQVMAHNPLRHAGQPWPRYVPPAPWNPPPLPPRRPTRPKRAPWQPPMRAATPARVQHGKAAFAATNTVAVTLNGVASGNTLIIFTGWNTTAVTMSTVVASGNNVVTTGASANNSLAGGARADQRAVYQAEGGNTTITITLSANSTGELVVAEYSGVSTVVSTQGPALTSGGGTGNTQTPTITQNLSQDSGFAVSFACDGSNSGNAYTSTTLTLQDSGTGALGWGYGDHAYGINVRGFTSTFAVATSAVQWAIVTVILMGANTVRTTASNSIANAAANSLAMSAFTPTPGTINLVMAQCATGTTNSVVDGNGNNYSRLSVAVDGNGHESSVWYFLYTGAAATNNGNTVSFSAVTAVSTLRISFVGVIGGPNMFGPTGTNTGSGATWTVSTSSATPVANGIGIGLIAVGTVNTPSVSAPLNSWITQTIAGAGIILGFGRYLGATGVETASGTILGGTTAWAAHYITFMTAGVVPIQTVSQPAALSGTAFPFNTLKQSSLFLRSTNTTSGGIASISDGPGNTWVQTNTQAYPVAGSVEAWRVKSGLGGKVLITIVNTGVPNLKGVMAEYTGLSLTAAADVNTKNSGTSVTPSVVGAQPAFNYELVLAFAGNGGNNLIAVTNPPPYRADGYTGSSSSGTLSHALVLTPANSVPAISAASFSMTSGAWGALMTSLPVVGSGAYLTRAPGTETVTGSDTVKKGLGAALSVSLSTTDAMIRRLSFGRLPAESSPVTDGVTRGVAFGRALAAEASTTADAIARRLAVGRLLEEAQSTADTATRHARRIILLVWHYLGR